MSLSNLTIAKRQLNKFATSYNNKVGYNCLRPGEWHEEAGGWQVELYAVVEYLTKELICEVEKKVPTVVFVGGDFDKEGMFLILRAKEL